MKYFGVILQVYGTENLVSMMNYFFDSICFHDDLTYDWISFGGWGINLTDHFLPDIRTSTLTAFLSMNYSAFHNICEYLYVHFLIVCLDELEGWKLCEGVKEKTATTTIQVIQTWDGAQLRQQYIHRSTNCNVISKNVFATRRCTADFIKFTVF